MIFFNSSEHQTSVKVGARSRSGMDLPHLPSHYSLSGVECCSETWAPGASLLPRLLTRFPALPQRLVKVTASVKIKEMHAAFMSFL